MADQEVGFTTQGAVNWDSAASSTLSYTVGLLGRLSTRGVDIYTVTVGQTGIGGLFSLSDLGRKRVDEVMRKASCFSTFTKGLYVGIGMEHVSLLLAKTKNGQNFLVLANCLTEVYDSEFSANVMARIFDEAFPNDPAPSTAQWVSLLKSASGVLATTHFSRYVEIFMSYYDPEDFKDGSKRKLANPADISHALVLLFKMCRRDRIGDSLPKLSQVTLRGGASCGFVAAFGFYYLGLDVQLWKLPRKRGSKKRKRGSKNEKKEELILLFESNSKLETPNIVIHYEYQRRDWRQPNAPSTDLALVGSAKVHASSFVIRDIYDVVRPPVQLQDRFIDPVIGGTISWNKLLSEGFPVAGNVLLRKGEILGLFIGYTARLLEYAAINNQTSEVNMVRLSPEQYGARYIQNALRYFPELEDCEKYMRRGYSATTLEAVEGYRQTCSKLGGALEVEEAMKLTHYLVIYLIWAFSSMVIADGLLPSKKGLLSIGFKAINGTLGAFSGLDDTPDGLDDNPDGSMNKPAIVLYHPTLWGEPEFLHWSMTQILVPESAMYTAICLFGDSRSIPDGLGGVLKDIAWFSGSGSNNDTLYGMTGCCIRGITLLYGLLKDVTVDPFHAGRVHVVPGSIETEAGHSYFEIIDPQEPNGKGSKMKPEWDSSDSESETDDSNTEASIVDFDDSPELHDEKLLSSSTDQQDKGAVPSSGIDHWLSERKKLLQHALGVIPGIGDLATDLPSQDANAKPTRKRNGDSLLRRMLRRADRMGRFADTRNAKIVITEQPGQLRRLFLTVEYPTAKLGSYALLRRLLYGRIHPAAYMGPVFDGISYSVRRISASDGGPDCKNHAAVANCGNSVLDWDNLPFNVPLITHGPQQRGLDFLTPLANSENTSTTATDINGLRHHLFIVPTLARTKGENEASVESIRSEVLVRVDEIEEGLHSPFGGLYSFHPKPVFDQIFVRESGCISCSIARISEYVRRDYAAQARASFFQSVMFDSNLALSEKYLWNAEPTSILLRAPSLQPTTLPYDTTNPVVDGSNTKLVSSHPDDEHGDDDLSTLVESESFSPDDSAVRSIRSGSIDSEKYGSSSGGGDSEGGIRELSSISSPSCTSQIAGVNIKDIEPPLDPKFFSPELRVLLAMDDKGNIPHARLRNSNESPAQLYSESETEEIIRERREFHQGREKLGRAYLLIL
ncbi:hypothetical protein BJ508DRAFT_418711 [Ascobolus immersus RN42]|uniref:Uncharacterized protein n=1 Tax=Ascobolus immersus RN42 TaxID=1160509 RepID=A0A3N4HX69_ASCIM|nr:hypothetical protein BJ508DRAFT_418711 [Ascobolus immersus RN42]